jgi:hypothetical protein
MVCSSLILVVGVRSGCRTAIIPQRESPFLCNADTVVGNSWRFCDGGSVAATKSNTLALTAGRDCFTGDRIYSQIKK